MELRVLQYFLAVAREQNISAAAQSLHLTQPTLSTQLKGLEEELGCQLLVRGTKGSRKVTLTEEGMILRKRAEEILSLVHKTQEEVTCANETVVGTISIGAGETEIVRYFAWAPSACGSGIPASAIRFTAATPSMCWKPWTKADRLWPGLWRDRPQKVSIPASARQGHLGRADAEGLSPGPKGSHQRPDLWDKPLLLSHQRGGNDMLAGWLQRDYSQLNVVATYNLVFNASLLVDEAWAMP